MSENANRWRKSSAGYQKTQMLDCAHRRHFYYFRKKTRDFGHVQKEADKLGKFQPKNDAKNSVKQCLLEKLLYKILCGVILLIMREKICSVFGRNLSGAMVKLGRSIFGQQSFDFCVQIRSGVQGSKDAFLSMNYILGMALILYFSPYSFSQPSLSKYCGQSSFSFSRKFSRLPLSRSKLMPNSANCSAV